MRLNLFFKLWLIHVPAAAVIHEWRALYAVIGSKKCYDKVTKVYKDKIKYNIKSKTLIMYGLEFWVRFNLSI